MPSGSVRLERGRRSLVHFSQRKIRSAQHPRRGLRHMQRSSRRPELWPASQWPRCCAGAVLPARTAKGRWSAAHLRAAGRSAPLTVRCVRW